MIHRTIITPQLIAYTGQNLGEGKLLPMDKLYKRNPQKRRERERKKKPKRYHLNRQHSLPTTLT